MNRSVSRRRRAPVREAPQLELDGYQMPSLLEYPAWFFGLGNMEQSVVKSISEEKGLDLPESLEYAIKRKKGVDKSYAILLSSPEFIAGQFPEQFSALKKGKRDSVEDVSARAQYELNEALTDTSIRSEHRKAWIALVGSKEVWEAHRATLESVKKVSSEIVLGDKVMTSYRAAEDYLATVEAEIPLIDARRDRKLDELHINRTSVERSRDQVIQDIKDQFERRMSDLQEQLGKKIQELRKVEKISKKQAKLLEQLEGWHEKYYGEPYKETETEDLLILFDEDNPATPYKKSESKGRRIKKRYLLAATAFGAAGYIGYWEATRGQVLECIAANDRSNEGCMKDGAGDFMFDHMRLAVEKSGIGVEWLQPGHIDASELMAKYDSDIQDPTELLERIDRMVEVAKMMQVRADKIEAQDRWSAEGLEEKSTGLYDQIHNFLFEKLNSAQRFELLAHRGWTPIFSKSPDFKDMLIMRLSHDEAVKGLDLGEVPDHLEELIHLSNIEGAENFAALLKAVPRDINREGVLWDELLLKIEVLSEGQPLFAEYGETAFEFVKAHFQDFDKMDTQSCAPTDGVTSNAVCRMNLVKDILGFSTPAEYRAFNKDFISLFSVEASETESGENNREAIYDPSIFQGGPLMSGAVITQIEAELEEKGREVHAAWLSQFMQDGEILDAGMQPFQTDIQPYSCTRGGATVQMTSNYGPRDDKDVAEVGGTSNGDIHRAVDGRCIFYDYQGARRADPDTWMVSPAESEVLSVGLKGGLGWAIKFQLENQSNIEIGHMRAAAKDLAFAEDGYSQDVYIINAETGERVADSLDADYISARKLQKGDVLEPNQPLAEMWSSGTATGPHAHKIWRDFESPYVEKPIYARIDINGVYTRRSDKVNWVAQMPRGINFASIKRYAWTHTQEEPWLNGDVFAAAIVLFGGTNAFVNGGSLPQDKIDGWVPEMKKLLIDQLGVEDLSDQVVNEAMIAYAYEAVSKGDTFPRMTRGGNPIPIAKALQTGNANYILMKIPTHIADTNETKDITAGEYHSIVRTGMVKFSE